MYSIDFGVLSWPVISKCFAFDVKDSFDDSSHAYSKSSSLLIKLAPQMMDC